MYILIIALGFWLRPTNKLFLQLGFLVPFSTILNGILKNIFQISRPPIEFWLAQPTDELGFPSGDVQVATVFWGMILLNVRASSLKLLIAIIIGGIGCSRIYLGVHSIADVLVGFLIAIPTIYVWRLSVVQQTVSGWWNDRSASLWGITIFLIACYGVIAKNSQWPSVIIMSIGAIIGVCLSAYFKPNTAKHATPSLKRVGVLLLSLMVLITAAKFIPIVKTSVSLWYVTGVVKYTIIIYGIFHWLPMFQQKLLTNKAD